MSPLDLYMSFIEDFVKSETGSEGFSEDNMRDVAADAGPSCHVSSEIDFKSVPVAPWSTSDARRFLLLHALKGAQESANTEGVKPNTLHSSWVPGLLQVRCAAREIPLEIVYFMRRLLKSINKSNTN